MSDPIGKWCPFVRVEQMQEPPLSGGEVSYNTSREVITNRGVLLYPSFGSGYVPVETQCIGTQCAAYVSEAAVEGHAKDMGSPNHPAYCARIKSF